MILRFADVAVLRLALTSGLIPVDVALAPCRASISEGGIVVAFSAKLSTDALRRLTDLGASCRCDDLLEGDELSCWLQIFPLKRDTNAPPPGPQTPVLFDLTEGHQLPEVVAEVLRLGNDRQSFRWLNADGQPPRCLLRVVGPPYYSLLRALDRDGPGAPRAFVERKPRLWIELGHDHPLADLIETPAGQLLLLCSPRGWQVFDDAPWNDIYDVLEFVLPAHPVAWKEARLERHLTVPLRLTTASSRDQAELWVLYGDATVALDAYVAHADDAELARLDFAVGEAEGRRTVVLRIRPSRQAAPQLVLPGAIPYRAFQKLPNLFLPCGTMLHPPLRKDAVRKLLAEDPARVTWLVPTDGGGFVPESLPDSCFRPLRDWVDYVLDSEHVALTAWIQSTTFDFEGFVREDDETAGPKPSSEKKPQERKDRRRNVEQEDEAKENEAGTKVNVVKGKRSRVERPLDAIPTLEPTELQRRLDEAERRFLALQAPPEASERRAAWRELAELNAAIGNATDASTCWTHALWEENDPVQDWTPGWLNCERLAAFPNRSRNDDAFPNEARDLEDLLATDNPTTASLRWLAASLAHAAHTNEPVRQALRDALIRRLDRVQRFLERFDTRLPVRACWLAWIGLARLARGDVLALARARDRLLERLLEQGLHPEFDAPSFLRFAGQRGSERHRAFRDRLLRLHDLAQRWIAGEAVATSDYVSLVFAWGFARLGEVENAKNLLAQATSHLKRRDAVHSFLLHAYAWRIQEALEGRSGSTALPDELLARLDKLDRIERYKVDRLRQHSRILEPHQHIDPYRRWQGRYADELGQQLAALHDQTDRAALQGELRQLLKRGPTPRVLEAAMQLAPRLGEAFAREVLDLARQVKPPEEPVELARFVERALFVAAHYDAADYVQTFVTRFQDWLASQHGTSIARNLDVVVQQCFRSLRKVGLRDAIDQLLTRMADLILGDDRQGTFERRLARPLVRRPELLCPLLQVASGWFYFQRLEPACAVLDAVRDVLFRDGLLPHEQTRLACSLATALGQAPFDLALPMIEELLTRLQGVHDTFTTNTHYALSRLDVVEAIVRAVAHDNFAVGSEMRRWLDEDEYLVRRRVHRDLRVLLNAVGM